MGPGFAIVCDNSLKTKPRAAFRPRLRYTKLNARHFRETLAREVREEP
jgi:hypothetical protein